MKNIQYTLSKLDNEQIVSVGRQTAKNRDRLMFLPENSFNPMSRLLNYQDIETCLWANHHNVWEEHFKYTYYPCGDRQQAILEQAKAEIKQRYFDAEIDYFGDYSKDWKVVIDLEVEIFDSLEGIVEKIKAKKDKDFHEPTFEKLENRLKGWASTQLDDWQDEAMESAAEMKDYNHECSLGLGGI